MEEYKKDVSMAISKGVDFMAVGSPVSPVSPVSGSSCDSALPKLNSFQRRTTGPTRRSAKGGWTKEEDDLLTETVKKFNGKNWKRIAESFPGRSDVQCLHRWQKVLNPDLVKGPWTKEEDDRIIELVDKFGIKKWSAIAQHLPGRIGKQCRERWHNHLNPTIKKDAWTVEEEDALIKAHRIYGNKWAEIARFLPGRADNSIKNHWNCSVKKKLDKCKVSGDLPGSNASGICNQDKKEESLKVNQSPRIVRSFKQKRDSNGHADTALGTSVLGNSNEGHKYQQIKRNQAKNSRAFQEEASCQPGPLLGVQLNGGSATEHGSIVEYCGRDARRASTPDDSHHSVTEPEVSSKISLGYSVDAMPVDHSSLSLGHPSRKCINEPVDYTNPSPRPSSGQNTVTSSSLKFPLDVTCSPEIALSLTTKRVPDSPKRPRHYATPIKESGGVSRFGSEYIDPFPNSSACRFGAENGQLCRQDEVPTTPQQSKDINSGPSYCESPQQKDINVFPANRRFLSTDNCTHLANSPVCYTPSSQIRSVSVSGNSPVSILRSAARTFKNIPSIIRKRRYANDSKDECTPEVRSGSSKDTLGSTHSCPSGISDQDDLNSTDFLKAKWLSISSPSCLQPEMIASVKSVEKRLQHAFDMEWDRSQVNCNSVATGSDSSDGNL